MGTAAGGNVQGRSSKQFKFFRLTIENKVFFFLNQAVFRNFHISRIQGRLSNEDDGNIVVPVDQGGFMVGFFRKVRK